MDTYTIQITSQAKEHLTLIRDYIAHDLKEPEIAKNMLRLLRTEMYSLDSLPHRIKCIEEKPWGDLGFRKLRVKNYYIYFRIDEALKEVQILAVIYTKVDQEKQLEKL